MGLRLYLGSCSFKQRPRLSCLITTIHGGDRQCFNRYLQNMGPINARAEILPLNPSHSCRWSTLVTFILKARQEFCACPFVDRRKIILYVIYNFIESASEIKNNST